MNRNPVARGIAIVLLGIVFAYFMEHDRQKWQRLGREAFMANQAERYNTWIEKPHPLAATVIGAGIATAFVFGLYELVVLVVSKILGSSGQPQQGPPGGSGVPFS